jgi:hypothetical protein
MDYVVRINRVYIVLDFYTPKLGNPELHIHIIHSLTTQRLAHTVDRDETVEQTNVHLDAQCAEKLWLTTNIYICVNRSVQATIDLVLI